MALRGSPVGFATENGKESHRISLARSLANLERYEGGSVSMPAAFNGVCSIVPSYGRLSTKGIADMR